MTSISGFVFVNDMELGRKYGTRVNNTTLEIKDVDGTYTVFLKLFPNQLKSTYLLDDLDSVQSFEKKVVLKFLKPNHELLVMSDDVDKVMNFLKDLRSLAKNLILNIGESFLANALKTFGHINNNPNRMQNFNPTHLRMIALENCNLPHLPEGIGYLTLSSLSLNGSRLNMSKYGQDLFWDWMTKENISTSLNVLEMNSIGLNKLPFEIIHLKRLQTLSVSNNKLTHVPHFIGELPQLVTLMIDGNSLWYFPEILLNKVYQTLKIFNNRFIYLKFNEERRENVEFTGLQNPPKLSDLSVLSLINNCIKFKRQEIPRPLWNSYDFVCRCRLCKKLFVFDEKYQKFTFSIPKTEQMVRIESIHWQFFECPSCVRLVNINA
ncbi:leucine-rich repeat-containing protein 40-like [Metopolophium dirhodum]|uniref:leucine-rich repeat-containing protein 40-like n=1 Tax=Metopolophium dirhodum TaxID=44670 RepID=UPI00298F6A72|nr:leucine-rich repeat-containing protein 40-like [Metopolophium dirhodum]